MVPKKTTQEKVVPPKERFDFERMELMNPNDPRAVGPPCHGEHEVAPPGRGSVTGAHTHAMWEGCLLTRKARPLGGDVAKQLEEKKPSAGSMDLQNKPGRGQEIFARSPEQHPEAEGGLGRHAEEGPLRQENSRGGRPRWWIPERPIGPRHASQVGGNVEDHMVSQTPGRKVICKAEMTKKAGVPDKAGVPEEGGGRRLAEGEP